jgi:hypothetical protein
MSYQPQTPSLPPPEVQQGMELDAGYLAKKAKRGKTSHELAAGSVSITSLMDAMTIIL